MIHNNKSNTSILSPTGTPSRELIYICPKCSHALICKEQKYICHSCSSLYPIIDGLPIFSKNENFYYGEVPKKIFTELLELSAKTSTQIALNHFLNVGKIGSFAYNYCCDTTRGLFFILLAPGHDKRVLDLGCGWGNISIALARTFSECYSMDLTKERAKFLSLRAREAGLHNITCLCGGDLDFLPFRDNFFDCVVMNGVLEWVPENSSRGRPKDIQLNFLKEVNRVLNKKGQIYLAIENRFALDYFQGLREDHTGMLYTSIMPRIIANFVSKKTRGKEYRTYTYSKFGYHWLLKKAGFNKATFYVPYPNYRSFDTIFSMNIPVSFTNHVKKSSYRPSWKTRLKALLMPYMSHSYSIVADKKHQGSKSWIALFLDYINTHYNKAYVSLLFPQITITATSGLGLIFKNENNRGLYVAICVDNLSLENQRKQFKHLTYLQNKYASTELSRMIPVCIEQGVFLGVSYYSYSLIHAENMSGSSQKEWCLNRLCSLFASESINSNSVQENLRIDNILISIDLCSIVVQNKKEFFEKYEMLLEKAGSLRHPIHGDLWPSNIVINSKGACFIIDWADFEKEGLPLYDLFHFYMFPESCGKGHFFYMLNKACSQFPTHLELKLTKSIKNIYSTWEEQYFTSERVSSLFLLYVYDNLVRRIRRGQNQREPFEKLIDITIKGPFPLPAISRIMSIR